MILLQLKAYIKQRHQVKKSDLLNHFDLSEDALEGLVERLTLQGNVVELSGEQTDSKRGASGGSGCGTACGSSCASHQTEYLWVHKRTKPLRLPIQVR